MYPSMLSTELPTVWKVYNFSGVSAVVSDCEVTVSRSQPFNKAKAKKSDLKIGNRK